VYPAPRDTRCVGRTTNKPGSTGQGQLERPQLAERSADVPRAQVTERPGPAFAGREVAEGERADEVADR